MTHPNKDLGIITECPITKDALNISAFTIPMLGDSVISYGFGDLAKVWEGTISDVFYDSKEDPLANHHWTNKSVVRINGEYIIQSAQHTGQSGSAVSNGCGYLGMAHIVVNENFAVFAGIIPATHIIEFIDLIIDKYPGRLKKLEECPPLKVISFPVSPFMACEKIDEVEVCDQVDCL